MGRYVAIKNNDIDNGPGLRVSVWFSGCPHKCKNCHNKEAWNEELGKDFTDETIDNIVSMLDGNGMKQDLSILGGEPLAPYNIGDTIALVNTVRKSRPDTSIWLWTGYTTEELNELYCCEDIPILSQIEADVIIDGRYVQQFNNKDKYRGSSNQRIIDHQKSLKTGELNFYVFE